MAKKVQIQVQDQFGTWRNYTTTSGAPPSIKVGLDQALKSPLGKNTGKARAIDSDTKQWLDIKHK